MKSVLTTLKGLTIATAMLVGTVGSLVYSPDAEAVKMCIGGYVYTWTSITDPATGNVITYWEESTEVCYTDRTVSPE